MQDELKVMVTQWARIPHFEIKTVNHSCIRAGCLKSTPAEAERFRRDNTPTEAKGDGG